MVKGQEKIVVVPITEREVEEEVDLGKEIKTAIARIMNLNTLPKEEWAKKNIYF